MTKSKLIGTAIGALAAETLLPWMGRLSSSAYRRAVTTAVLATEDGGLSVLSKKLPVDSHSAGLEHRQYVREFLHAISHHPGEHAIPLLTRLLETEDVETRRESFVALSRYPDPEVDDLSLERSSTLGLRFFFFRLACG